MDNRKTDDKRDLLGQLTKLEQQVSALSSEIRAKSETIEILERSLNEKQLHISELEAALRVAQQSMLDLAWDNVQHYQQQIRAGISRSLTDPKFAQFTKLLELIRSFPTLSRQFIEIRIVNPGRHFVPVASKNIDAVKGDSTWYYQNTLKIIISKYRLSLERIKALFALFIEETQNFVDQKVLWPIRNACDDVNEILHEAPAEARFLLKEKVVKPLWQYFWSLSVRFSKVQIEVQSLTSNIRRSLQPLLSRWYDIVTGKIKDFKDSQGFGSHDRGMSGNFA